MEKLEPNKYYHIYNRGINSENIFINNNDYERFINLLEKYIDPIAEIYAWCLLKNHFHLLVKIKDNIAYKCSKKDKPFDKDKFELLKWETTTKTDKTNNEKLPDAIKHFSHLFNSYAKYFNNKHKRHGNLFERSFERKEIISENYFRNTVVYIHRNSVNHGFCEFPLDWAWSSYLDYISVDSGNTKNNVVIDWFDDLTNFKFVHNKNIDDIEFLEMVGIE